MVDDGHDGGGEERSPITTVGDDGFAGSHEPYGEPLSLRFVKPVQSSAIMWVPLCNFSPIARLYPTLILPLQRGGDLPNGIWEKTGNQHPRKTRKRHKYIDMD